MFNTIIQLLYSGDILNLLLNFFFLIYFIILIIIYNKCKKDNKKLKIWKMLCFLPFIISVIHCIIFVVGSAFLSILSFYISIYIPAILIALIPLLANKKVIYNTVKVIIIIVCIICTILSIDSSKIANYTNKSLSDAYISLCDYLEDNYVLSEWKKIDYKKLKKEGLELIKEAEKTDNINKYYEALNNIVSSLYDGHAGLDFYAIDYNYNVEKIKEFNDYGLSLITLDDGTTIAINVEDNIEIKEGDIITKWNDVLVNEAIEKVILPLTEGTLENEKIQKTFYLAGLGDDTVKVTYINSSNEEKVATLNKIDNNLPRAINSFGLLNHTKNEEYTYKMINNNIGYLRVTEEETNIFSDYYAYLTGNHKYAREKFRKDLRKLKEQGMTKLVIDIRNNAGGYEEVATALTSLFTKEKMYAFSLGIRKDKKLKSIADRYVYGDGEFSDLQIIVLTGMRCGSAGDGLVKYLSRLDNVTVAGLTNPSGINQEVGGYVYMPENAIITFPTGLVLDENGNPNIDIDETRISRNPIDIKIPLNKESAIKIFNGIDYELEWAIEYLNR